MTLATVMLGLIVLLLIAACIGIPLGHRKYKKKIQQLEDNIPEETKVKAAKERKEIEAIAIQEEAEKKLFFESGQGVQGTPTQNQEEQKEVENGEK